MSTPSRSASAAAFGSGRTLKPMTTALEAEARSTSDSVMPPTEPCRTLRRTSSVESRRSASLVASTEPCTSAFRTTFSSFTAPVWICW